MARAPHGLGGVLVPALTLMGVLGIGAATVITIPRPERPGDDASAPALTARQRHNLDLANTESALRRVHLTPEALAAAGLSVEQVAAVIAAMLIQVEGQELGADLRAATRANNQAVQAAGKAKPAPGQEPVSAATRAANLTAARATLDGLLDTAWTNATATLTQHQKTKLANIRANAPWDGLPVQYLVVERSSADWIKLRGALAHERLAAREGYNGPHLTQAVQAFLTEVRADEAVSAARTALDLNLESIKIEWRTRLDPR